MSADKDTWSWFLFTLFVVLSLVATVFAGVTIVSIL